MSNNEVIGDMVALGVVGHVATQTTRMSRSRTRKKRKSSKKRK